MVIDRDKGSFRLSNVLSMNLMIHIAFVTNDCHAYARSSSSYLVKLIVITVIMCTV